MLCDRLLALFQLTAERGHRSDNEFVEAQSMMSAVGAAGERFSLSPQLVQILNELSVDLDNVERQHHLVCLPHSLMWVECLAPVSWNGGAGPFGVAVDNRGAKEGIDARIIWFLPCAEGLKVDRWTLRVPTVAGGKADLHSTARSEIEDVDPGRAYCWFITLLAVLSTPRLTEKTHHDVSKINRARAKAGNRKPPALSWSEVTLRRDSNGNPVRGASMPGSSGHNVTGRAVASHSVRAHWRFRRGQVELVREHRRGDPEIGSRQHHYLVRTQSENPGASYPLS
jgi:hypothetical protein